MNDIDTNILLGTYYLSMIYNQLDRSAVLATAGYNAGPGRPRKWQANLPRPVEGAIFAETVPSRRTNVCVEARMTDRSWPTFTRSLSIQGVSNLDT